MIKTTVLQTDIKWADPEANHIHASEMIKQIGEDVDLIVLPEMFSTGFATQPDGIAERDASLSLKWMQQTANKTNSAIVASVATETEDGKMANRMFFVKPGGETAYYDKHHLFTYGGENKRYTRGESRKVVEWRGMRFLLQVCYDLRFPVFSRNTGDYDAIIYVASWPTSRVNAWSTLLKARAIENQCYVIGVNRVGTDPQCIYPGASAIIDPYGNLLAEGNDKERTLFANLDMDSLNKYREKFPVLDDRDEFTIS